MHYNELQAKMGEFWGELQSKPVNDSFGHGAGDRLLVAVEQRIRTLIRTEDTLARLSGDEFVILQGGISCVADDTL